MKSTMARVIIILSLVSFTLMAAPVPKEGLPPKEKFYLFLLVGQSNMAGRGVVEEEDKVPYPRVLTLDKEGKWVPAVDPIHFDKSAAGVGLGRSFARMVAEHDPEVTVGLIPCACGGSPISAWTPRSYYAGTKSHPYDDAIARTKLAMEAGTLKGILWHQGEADCSEKNAPLYEERLSGLIARFRTDLGSPDVPFVIGQLGQFLAKKELPKIVTQAQINVAGKVKNSAFVNSDGLTHKGDNVHFDSASQREFGRRYFKAWQQVVSSKN